MGCASVLRTALVKGGVQKPSKIAPNKGKGFVIVLGEFKHEADLGAVAKLVSEALTPHRKQVAPGLSVELFAKLDAASAKTALQALAKIQGVDAKRSKAHTKRGVISVRLTGGGKVSVNDLIATLKKSGIAARVVTGGS